MSIRLKNHAALFISAAFLFSSPAFAQAPIVDASAPSSITTRQAQIPEAKPIASEQSQLFYQLQLLQQEVMQLRGLVEEQAHSLERVKEQNRERYIDLDRRLGEIVAAPTAETGVAALPAKSTTELKGEKQAYDQAYTLVKERRFDDALEAFKQFLIDYPGGKYTANSYYWMGELYQVVTPQNLEGARQSFTQLLEQYPTNTKAADAMYKLGKVYYLKGDKTKSKQLLEKVIAEYSKGTSSSTADKAQQFINTNF
ncbi:MAG: tol-pal system protein YbgF [Spongiibacteraceae bacterium]